MDASVLELCCPSSATGSAVSVVVISVACLPNVLTGPGVQASAREGNMGNLGQFEARLLRLLAPSSNAAAGSPAAAGTASPAPAPAGPDPAAIAAAALDPLAANYILGLFFAASTLLFHSWVPYT